MYYLRVIVPLTPLAGASTDSLFSIGIRGLFDVNRPITVDVDLWPDRAIETVPQCVFDSNPVCEDSPLLQAPLLAMLGHSARSTVYLLGHSTSERVIKYNAFCQGDDRALGNFPSPIDLETHFLQLLNQRAPGVTITHYFSSEAITQPAGIGKFHDPPPSCKFGRPALVQYMIMERAGPTLSALGKFDLHAVAAIGLQLIRLFRQIHALGLVHADLHPGNVAVTYQTPRRLMLIDFGLAHYGTDTLDDGGSHVVNCNPHYTIWEASGWDARYRDDVIRVVQLMAVLLHGRPYLEGLGTVCIRDTPQFVRIKQDSDWFNPDLIIPHKSVPNRVKNLAFRVSDSVAAEDLSRVQPLLLDLQRIVRDLRRPDQLPDYDGIERVLIAIVSVFTTLGPEDDPAAIHFM